MSDLTSIAAMGEVAAFVLALGERTTARAIASLQAQTLRIEEIVVVDGIRPFHRAFNAGVQRTSRPFVLQVDSDFVLDQDCAQTLRDGMAPSVGITVAPLRDPLIGSVSGVKMFRRECLTSAPLRDTIAPEIDLCWTLQRRGWRTRYLTATRRRQHGHTLGAHRPHNTLEYVFGTYFLLGTRYVLHNDPMGILWRLGQLRSSPHKMASVARLAMAHGMFAQQLQDAAKPAPAASDLAFLHHLTAVPPERRSGSREARATARKLASLSPVPLLDACLELGSSLRARSHCQFRELLDAVAEWRAPWSWVAEAGLGNGALAGTPAPAPAPTVATLEQLATGGLSRLFPRAAPSWA
jgi:hypothetical protein